MGTRGHIQSEGVTRGSFQDFGLCWVPRGGSEGGGVTSDGVPGVPSDAAAVPWGKVWREAKAALGEEALVSLVSHESGEMCWSSLCLRSVFFVCAWA